MLTKDFRSTEELVLYKLSLWDRAMIFLGGQIITRLALAGSTSSCEGEGGRCQSQTGEQRADVSRPELPKVPLCFGNTEGKT